MPKPGRKSGPITEHAKEYERDGLKRGVTVAEWEKERGLPRFSVYPEAEKATELHMKGYFMYRDATPEERAVMTKGMFMKIKKNYGDLEAIKREKERKRAKERERWARKRDERIREANAENAETEAPLDMGQESD